MIKNLEIAYTLSPREPSTINNSLQSLRQIGFKNKVKIFAEPWEYEFDDENVEMVWNDHRFGCFKNFDQVLRNCKEDYLLYTQCDYVHLLWMKQEVARIINSGDDFGYYNFILHWMSLWSINNDGWNEFTRGSELCGACYLIKKSNIQKIIESDYYKHHKLTNEMNLDACIWESCKRLRLPWFIPSSSYVIHTGKSTINHNDILLGKHIKKKF